MLAGPDAEQREHLGQRLGRIAGSRVLRSRSAVRGWLVPRQATFALSASPAQAGADTLVIRSCRRALLRTEEVRPINALTGRASLPRMA